MVPGSLQWSPNAKRYMASEPYAHNGTLSSPLQSMPAFIPGIYPLCTRSSQDLGQYDSAMHLIASHVFKALQVHFEAQTPVHFKVVAF